jgi:hypothetical protein
MRRIGIAVTTAALAVGLAACNGTSIKSTPDATGTAKGTVAAGAKAKPKVAPVAHIGDTITLHGMQDGSKLTATLVKWVDPARGGDEFTTPDSGKRFVAAQLRLTDVGTTVYDDSPSNGVQVADTEGQRFDSDISDVSAGPSMAPEVKLSPGDRTLGYISFQVPKTSKVASLQFTLDSGFADQTGEWHIG